MLKKTEKEQLMSRGKVISFGEVLYDVFPDRRHLGGAPLNLAVHLFREGMDVLLVSAVGSDDYGREALDTIRETGLDVSGISEVANPTGRVTISLDAAGVPEYLFDRDCAYDHITLPENFDCSADLLCFGTLAQRGIESRKTLQKLLKEFKGKVFCDVNLRQDFYSKEILEDSLNCADIVKINENELPVIAELTGIGCTPQELAEKFDLELVIYTLGPEGCVIYARGDEPFTMPAAPAEVVSTVGAGDAFSGAFLASLLKNEDLITAAEKASRNAAYVCTLEGAF